MLQLVNLSEIWFKLIFIHAPKLLRRGIYFPYSLAFLPHINDHSRELTLGAETPHLKNIAVFDVNNVLALNDCLPQICNIKNPH